MRNSECVCLLRLYRVNIFHLVKCSLFPCSCSPFITQHVLHRSRRPDLLGSGVEEPFIRQEECRVSSINAGVANKSGHFQGHFEEWDKTKKQTPQPLTVNASNTAQHTFVRKVNKLHSLLNQWVLTRGHIFPSRWTRSNFPQLSAQHWLYLNIKQRRTCSFTACKKCCWWFFFYF